MINAKYSKQKNKEIVAHPLGNQMPFQNLEFNGSLKYLTE